MGKWAGVAIMIIAYMFTSWFTDLWWDTKLGMFHVWICFNHYVNKTTIVQPYYEFENILVFLSKDTNNPPSIPLVKKTLLLRKYLFQCDPAFNTNIIWNKIMGMMPINFVNSLAKCSLKSSLKIHSMILEMKSRFPRCLDFCPASGCRPPWSCDLWYMYMLGSQPPWTEGMTHACENIIPPQTSFAVGNYLFLRSVKRC